MEKYLFLIIAIVLIIVGICITAITGSVLSSKIPFEVNKNVSPIAPTVNDVMKLSLDSPGESINGYWYPVASRIRLWDPISDTEITSLYTKIEGYFQWGNSINTTIGSGIFDRTEEKIEPIVVFKFPPNFKPDSYPYEIRILLNYPKEIGSIFKNDTLTINVTDTLHIASIEDQRFYDSIKTSLSPYQNTGDIIRNVGGILLFLNFLGWLISRLKR
ncbi:MAG: hypothetical protein ABIE07_10580 [Candidatus Zixiibacteriota bacterium]